MSSLLKVDNLENMVESFSVCLWCMAEKFETLNENRSLCRAGIIEDENQFCFRRNNAPSDGYDTLHYLECISQGPALQECILISCPLSYRQRWDHEEIQVRVVKSFKHRLSSQCYSILPGVCGNSWLHLHLVPACSQCDNASILGTTQDVM